MFREPSQVFGDTTDPELVPREEVLRRLLGHYARLGAGAPLPGTTCCLTWLASCL